MDKTLLKEYLINFTHHVLGEKEGGRYSLSEQIDRYLFTLPELITEQNKTIREELIKRLSEVKEKRDHVITETRKQYWIGSEDAYRTALELVERPLPSGEQTEQGWIPVSERLPDDYDNYLVTVVGFIPYIAYFDFHNKKFTPARAYHITQEERPNLIYLERIAFWMPLPPPPKQ